MESWMTAASVTSTVGFSEFRVELVGESTIELATMFRQEQGLNYLTKFTISELEDSDRSNPTVIDIKEYEYWEGPVDVFNMRKPLGITRIEENGSVEYVFFSV